MLISNFGHQIHKENALKNRLFYCLSFFDKKYLTVVIRILTEKLRYQGYGVLINAFNFKTFSCKISK